MGPTSGPMNLDEGSGPRGCCLAYWGRRTSPSRAWPPHLGKPRVSRGWENLPCREGGVHLQLLLLAAALGGGAAPQTDLPSYIRRGRGKGGATSCCPIAGCPLSPLLLHLLLLRAPGEALQDLHLHLHHHTVVLLDVARRSTSPHPLLAGTRRGRTSSTPYARPSMEVLPERCTDSIDYINNEPSLVGFGILRG